MEFKEFGNAESPKIVLIPGSMMCWKQFDKVIPLLAKQYRVIAVSTDGFDGTGQTTFTTAEASSKKLADYLTEHHGGHIGLCSVNPSDVQLRRHCSTARRFRSIP